jgi:hypothetical protein
MFADAQGSVFFNDDESEDQLHPFCEFLGNNKTFSGYEGLKRNVIDGTVGFGRADPQGGHPSLLGQDVISDLHADGPVFPFRPKREADSLGYTVHLKIQHPASNE